MGNCGGKAQQDDNAPKGRRVTRSGTVRGATSPCRQQSLEHDGDNFRFFAMTKLHLKRLNKIGCHGHVSTPWAGRGSALSLNEPERVLEEDMVDKDEVIRPSFADDHKSAVPAPTQRKNSNERAASLVEEGVLDEAHADAYINGVEQLESAQGASPKKAGSSGPPQSPRSPRQLKQPPPQSPIIHLTHI
eukprot:m.37907 g.37907  ORF g.37907 m.37907 type:complete len:189 (-) comp7755_c0_seq2:4254-4820(-)